MHKLALDTLYLLDLDGLSILDQLMVEEALLRGSEGSFFVLNSSASAAVVLGLSNSVDDLVDMSVAHRLNLPIYRRFSGGGAVVVDGDTIFASFIFDHALMPCEMTPEGLMAFGASMYSKAFSPLELQVFDQDYALDGRKICGNAQSFTRGRALQHSSFLYSWNEQLMQVLKMPRRQPRYRQGRDHKNFCGRLENHFPDKQICRQRLKNSVQDIFKCENLAFEDLETILNQTYRKSVEVVREESFF